MLWSNYGIEFTDEDLKKNKIVKEAWSFAKDPSKGLLYLLENIDKYKNILDCKFYYIKLQKLDPNISINQYLKLKDFHSFIGDGKHYVICTDKSQNNILEKICSLSNTLDYEKINSIIKDLPMEKMIKHGILKLN